MLWPLYQTKAATNVQEAVRHARCKTEGLDLFHPNPVPVSKAMNGRSSWLLSHSNSMQAKSYWETASHQRPLWHGHSRAGLDPDYCSSGFASRAVGEWDCHKVGGCRVWVPQSRPVRFLGRQMVVRARTDNLQVEIHLEDFSRMYDACFKSKYARIFLGVFLDEKF